MNSFDLKIFKDEDYSYKCDTSNYRQCIAMNRLIHGMRYYSSLDIVNNEKHREIFVHFMVEIYGAFNDDYIHFQEEHENELEEIYNDLLNNKQFKKCGMNECKYTQRHHANDLDAITDNDDALLDRKLQFYKEMMDALHFHIFHCFDAGLRTLKRTDDEEDDDDDNEEQKGNDYFDAEFARMHRSILKGESNTKSLHRFSNENTKFSILTQNKNDNIERVYCDELLKHLLAFEVHNMDGSKALYGLIQSEEYDTDALQFDVSLKPNGNISENIKKKTFKNIYIDFVKTTKISARSFSIGFRFYYWIYYKNRTKLEDEDDYNVNDHSGFDVKQLFVAAKYASLKEEITNNKHIIMKQYQQLIIKINQVKQSARFKKITATEYGTDVHHYEISKGDMLGFDHLLSLVLYTDYSALCTDFSSTFRRKNIFEPLQSVIKRNMEYYWMSKSLRECVEVFGQYYYDFEERWNKDYMRGPFYCGMSIAMNMNSFNLRLCSPSSTSKQIEVAMKFSGTQGMVLQLNNSGEYQYWRLHGFNASWISKYKEEDERLFFGGYWFIKVESVRIRATQKNYEKFIHSIYYLDTMVTGGRTDRLEVSADDVFILSNFMNKLLNKNKEITKTFDHYLEETFAAFVLNKTQIVLDLYQLNRIEDSGIRDLLMNDMVGREYDEEKRRENKDITNLFKAELLEIFKNVKNIIINTGGGLSNSFSFSMFGLLSLIDSGSVEHVVVKVLDDEGNWIKDIWSSLSNELTKAYQERNYKISMEDIDDVNESWFIINKEY